MPFMIIAIAILVVIVISLVIAIVGIFTGCWGTCYNSRAEAYNAKRGITAGNDGRIAPMNGKDLDSSNTMLVEGKPEKEIETKVQDL